MRGENSYGRILFVTVSMVLADFTSHAQYQPGMVEQRGGGYTFSAEQYKIDRMKTAPAPVVYTGTTYRPVETKKTNSNSDYEPGSGYMTNPKEWNRKEMELDYRGYSKKSRSKETQGLDFSYPDKDGVEVEHLNDGIEAYNTTVFHSHKKDYDNFNNILYDLYYSMPKGNVDNFGFGFQFITHRSSFHECKEYTFFSFFITAGGKLYYMKKTLPSAMTSGFFGALQRDIPETFKLENYKVVPIKAELKDMNLLTVIQWKDKFSLGLNEEIIYEDNSSRCPVQLDEVPYNLFLNKGTVKFFKGQELYTEKKHL